ncbi:MAG TPA: hypothetical protein VHZ54_08880 [Solirubrobacterales bacterium]|nr:hypothetical protein [Solirubrobacterales bacterium]
MAGVEGVVGPDEDEDEGGEADPGDFLIGGLFGFDAGFFPLAFGFGQPFFFRLPCTA